jgi:tripeptidyl-peptidase-1
MASNVATTAGDAYGTFVGDGPDALLSARDAKLAVKAGLVLKVGLVGLGCVVVLISHGAGSQSASGDLSLMSAQDQSAGIGDQQERVQLEEHFGVPKGWSSTGAVSSTSLVDMTIAIKQTNLDVLETKLLDVSNPKSSNYAQYLTMEEVNALVAPTATSVSAVQTWLKDGGVDLQKSATYSLNQDFMHIKMPVSLAESLLQTTYSTYQHADTGMTALRSSVAYSVPKQVASHIDLIGPTGRFPASPLKLHRTGAASSAAASPAATDWTTGLREAVASGVPSEITPAFLWSLYNVTEATAPLAAAAAGTTALAEQSEQSAQSVGAAGTAGSAYPWPRGQAVVSFLSELADASADSGSDLQAFLAQQVPGSVGAAPAVDSSLGAALAQSGSATAEASLDVQYIMGVGRNVPTTLCGVNGTSPDPVTTQTDGEPNEPFLKWASSLNSQPGAAALHSLSYSDNEDSVTKAYAGRINQEFLKAGLRGMSILVASGDAGVGGAWDDGSASTTPTFPTSSPWVTSVGGTQVSQSAALSAASATALSALSAGAGAAAAQPPQAAAAAPLEDDTDGIVDGAAVAAGRRLLPGLQGGGAAEAEASTTSAGATGAAALQVTESGAALSAGGFSNYWPRPAYQREAVAAYLKQSAAAAELQEQTGGSRAAGSTDPSFNSLGRGFPDVSALSHSFVVQLNGVSESVSGTSASTPAVAGLFGMLNERRAQAGKAPLGFLNQLIYQHTELFTDVSTGSNPRPDGAGAAGFTDGAGFTALRGWDPVSGVGSVNYGKLMEVTDNLP